MAGASQLEGAAAVLTATAALVVLAYRLGSGQPAAVALAAAFAVVVVAVPAAVGVATGLPHLVATERAARLGVLISGAGAFAAARRIDTVVLAGTDLLGSGELEVHAVHALDGVPRADVLRLAGAVVRRSDRPVDRAIAAASPRLPGVADLDPVDGLGARGVVAEVVGGPGEERVIAHAGLVGDPELLAAHDIELPAAPVAAGCTRVAVAWDGVARGLLDVGPRVTPAAATAVRGLAAIGVRPVLVATEEAPLAEAVAARAGISPGAVRAGVAPPDTARVVRELGSRVAVVADAERHRAALRTAHLAVRLPPHTHDTRRPALTSVHRDLGAVAQAVLLARRTAAVARANLVGSLTCAAVLLPLTVAGLLGPSLSAAATAACGAALVANSLRLQRPAATHG